MKPLSIKRNILVLSLVLITTLWAVSIVFAAPQEDGFVPTLTFTPTVTATSTSTPIPTDTPAPTNTPVPNEDLSASTATPEVTTQENQSNVAENSDASAAAGSSVLGFLLCAGVIIVAGLAALNIWAQRRP